MINETHPGISLHNTIKCLVIYIYSPKIHKTFTQDFLENHMNIKHVNDKTPKVEEVYYITIRKLKERGSQPVTIEALY